MRLLLASTAFTAVSFLMSSPAAAETVISTATTAPVSTGTAGDIRISSTGSIKPAGGAAVTINSNNSVANQGAIAIKGANGSTGILANANLAGNISNSGTITLDEDFTPVDSDKDGDLDGPFAKGSNRFGIHVLSGGTFTGNIVNSGTITIEGNQSAGIALDSTLQGSLTSNGKISVLGDGSAGIRAIGVSGNVTIGSGSAVSVQGKDSVGVLLGGDIGGALVVQGSLTSTGYRSVTPPADTSKLDADDLLQGGSALVVGGSVGGGILLDSPPPDKDPSQADEDHDGIADAKETTASVATFGSAPAIAIGSASQDISIGAVASSSLGHGLVIKGSVSGSGVYDGISATGVSIGGTGHVVNVAGGMSVFGSISASASKANSTALRIGSGASVPQVVVAGTVAASSSGGTGSKAAAILIDQGATVQAISNSGTISAVASGTNGSATAILDRSGTVGIVQNSSRIEASRDGVAGSGVAIDLAANGGGAIVRQLAAASGRPAPVISGSIRFGSGNDLLDIQSGSVLGSVDFGGGADAMSLSGGSLFRGSLANSAGASISVGTGSTLDATNLGAIGLSSLTVASGGALGVTIGDAGHTSYNVSGTATFADGSKIVVTLAQVGTAAGSYKIVDAGTLVGADKLASSIVTLPFLFNSKLSADSATGEVTLSIERKDSGALGLNRSESAILDPALDAADFDAAFSSMFLNVADTATLKDTLQQLMPDHAGGAFEAATKGSRLASEIFADPRPLAGLWFQQVAWGSSKSIGDTSSYKIGGWGVSAGYDVPLAKALSVGVTASYLWGDDKHLSSELISNHYDGGLYVRAGDGPLRGWARATLGTIGFENSRNFTSLVEGSSLTRTAKGSWHGTLYSGAGGISYEVHTGNLAIRPNVSVEYYKLDEKAYGETGGGDSLDLEVAGRSSRETAANAMLALGYELFGRQSDVDGGRWARIEIEGGRRAILSSSLGDTIAAFKDGTPFTLSAEQRTSGWRGGLRVAGGGPGLSVVAELNAEQQQGRVSPGGRAGLTLGF
ncbi:MAG: autotransporter domain-containing protein [Bacillota bacterium]